MGRARPLLREHWLFALVLVAAVLVRLGIVLTFWPALFYIGDSFDYLGIAYRFTVVGWGAVHPSGYPLLIKVMALPGRNIATIAVVQHIAGLGIGVLAYVLLLRLSVDRFLAALAAGFVLLNGWEVVLEQHILAETFFGLALIASAYLVIIANGLVATAGSGFLLGFSVLLRPVALVAAPIWLVYAAWKHRLSGRLLVGVVALAVPVVSYASVHAAAGRGFGFSQFDGWVLYGRVAGIADCSKFSVPRGTEGLCESTAERRDRLAKGWTPSRYVFSPRSPAERTFGYMTKEQANPKLRAFALAVIRDRPLTYVRTVASNLTWTFRPHAGRIGMDPGIFLHEQHESLAVVNRDPGVQKFLGGYHLRSYGPRHAVVRYTWDFQPPRPLLAALTAVPILTLLLAMFFRGGRGRLRLSRVHESTFLAAMGLALFVAAVAFAEFNLRFLMPALPLLTCAAALGVADLWALVASWQRRAHGRASAAARS